MAQKEEKGKLAKKVIEKNDWDRKDREQNKTEKDQERKQRI